MASNSTQLAYKSSTGLVTISVANSSLDGSGSISDLIVGGANGTFVKSVIIKALDNTTEGMIRIFVKKTTGTSSLLREIYVAPVNRSGRDLSFYQVIPLNYSLEAEAILQVSTQNAESFNIVAEALDLSYLTNTNFIGTSLEYFAANGTGVVNAANPNLDGSGALVKIFTAGPASSFEGVAISSISVKAQQTTSPGMVRLYISDNVGTNKFLFCEVMVPSIVQSGNLPSFAFEVLRGTLCLTAGYSIWASTENSDPFTIVIGASNWKYV